VLQCTHLNMHSFKMNTRTRFNWNIAWTFYVTYIWVYRKINIHMHRHCFRTCKFCTLFV
jgi:hypothetical protein